MHAQADPPPTPGTWQDPEGRRWQLVLLWSRVDGRIECSGIELRSGEDPPARLTTTVLRAFPFAATVQGSKRQIGDFHEWWTGTAKGRRRRLRPDPNLAPAVAELIRRAEEWRLSASGGGGAPPQYGPEHFAMVAAVYIAALNAGRPDPRQAVREWADSAGKSASSSAVAKWVARARKMGLLAPTTRGRT